MSTLRTPSRARKPLLPVNVQATLTIVSGDETDRDVRSYWTRILFDRNRKPYAVELVRFGDHEKRVVTLDDERCDCPDAIYRPDRPNSCKHVNALRQTFPAVAKGGAA